MRHNLKGSEEWRMNRIILCCNELFSSQIFAWYQRRIETRHNINIGNTSVLSSAISSSRIFSLKACLQDKKKYSWRLPSSKVPRRQDDFSLQFNFTDWKGTRSSGLRSAMRLRVPLFFFFLHLTSEFFRTFITVKSVKGNDFVIFACFIKVKYLIVGR